jgi:isopenicillin N synthase-like dioxygenase
MLFLKRASSSVAQALVKDTARPLGSFQIPVIEFGRFRRGNLYDQQVVADNMLSAFQNVGFVYLADHGIPQSKVDQVFQKSKEFFDQSMEEKLKLAWVSPEANRGYVAPGREKVSQLTDKEKIKELRESSPDLKESLEIGKEPSPTFQNNWPQHDPDFRPTMMQFFKDCHLLHLDVMDSIGLGLGLERGFFHPFCNQMDHNLRLLHYPSVDMSVLDKKV